MRVTHDHWQLHWLPIKLAAFLEGMTDAEYRRWLFKRLHWLSEDAIRAGETRPLIRPISMKVAPRHKHWDIRRDDWKYVHDSSLTPPARLRLERLRRREETVDEIADGQVEAEHALRLSFIDLALRCHLPGLLAVRLPARALDVRPCVSTRTLIASAARRVTLLRDDAALRKYLMNIEDVRKEVAERADLSHRQAEIAVHAVLQAVTDAMRDGIALHFSGFGTFKVVQRAPRAGHHPKTKAPLLIPARKEVVFHPADKLRKAVNA